MKPTEYFSVKLKQRSSRRVDVDGELRAFICVKVIKKFLRFFGKIFPYRYWIQIVLPRRGLTRTINSDFNESSLDINSCPNCESIGDYLLYANQGIKVLRNNLG